MILLHLFVAYVCGVVLGAWLWNHGWLDCDVPALFWLVPLTLLLTIPLLNRITPGLSKTRALRWSTRAGFQEPRYGPSPALLFALLVTTVLGLARYASHPLRPCLTPSDLAFYNLPVEASLDRRAPKVLLSGYVSSYPLVADRKQKMTVTATSVLVDGVDHPVVGNLRLNTDLRQQYIYGQPVLVRGRLVTPPEFDTFSWRDKLAASDIHSVLYDAQIDVIEGKALGGNAFTRQLYRVRAQGERLLNRLLPEPYAALANGMLLGIDAGIPDELYEQFNATGSSHVIVISGSNVALVVAIFLGMGKRIFGKRWAIAPTLLAIAGYAFLVGGEPAVLRAALMGGLMVIADGVGRRATALVSLAFACWIMTLINPLTVWDLGLQLSASATAGLILFSPGVDQFFSRLFRQPTVKKLAEIEDDKQTSVSRLEQVRSFAGGALYEALLATIAANIATLPLIVFYFGRLSAISLATNLLIVPFQPLILIPGSAAVVLGLLWESLAIPLLWLVHAVLWWTVTIVSWSAMLPFASISITSYSWLQLLFTYLAISLLHQRVAINAWWRWWSEPRRAGTRRRRILAYAAGILIIAAFVLWSVIPALPSGKLHVYFLDIGQGDGILIVTPSGRQVLMDGGKEPLKLDTQLRQVMPWWDYHIDLAVLTHPDSDHMKAQMALPGRYNFDYAIESTVSQSHPDALAWRKIMQANGAQISVEEANGMIDLGDGVTLDVLWHPTGGFVPPATDQSHGVVQQDSSDNSYDNENGLVMKLSYGEFSVLLTADIGIASEQAMIAQQLELRASVLKIGHHGSQYSSSPELIRAVNPQFAVIQSGQGNEYGHPHQATLDRLAGRMILRNDTHGRIEFRSDGHQVWIETARNEPEFGVKR